MKIYLPSTDEAFLTGTAVEVTPLVKWRLDWKRPVRRRDGQESKGLL